MVMALSHAEALVSPSSSPQWKVKVTVAPPVPAREPFSLAEEVVTSLTEYTEPRTGGLAEAGVAKFWEVLHETPPVPSGGLATLSPLKLK